jgi:hypothetical protein
MNCGSEPIDFSTVAQGGQREFITANVEVVNDAIVADAKAKLRSPLQTAMGEILQVAA